VQVQVRVGGGEDVRSKIGDRRMMVVVEGEGA
jgi:hypothetical protein